MKSETMKNLKMNFYLDSQISELFSNYEHYERYGSLIQWFCHELIRLSGSIQNSHDFENDLLILLALNNGQIQLELYGREFDNTPKEFDFETNYYHKKILEHEICNLKSYRDEQSKRDFKQFIKKVKAQFH